MTLVVVVHFGKNLSMLKRCVNSLLKNEKDIELLVVNNNSFAIDKKLLSKDSRLKVLNNKINLGYGGGFNSVLITDYYKKADQVMLVNNDTSIDKPIIHDLKKAMVDEKVGIAGPVVNYSKHGKFIFDLGGFIDNQNFPYHKEADNPQNKNPYEVDFLGVCLLIKKQVVNVLKGFDEDFFLYYEDVDFCLRAKRKGFTSVVVPTVVIRHGLSKTVGRESKEALYYQTKGAILYARKHVKRKEVFFVRLLVDSLKRIANNPLNTVQIVKAVIK